MKDHAYLKGKYEGRCFLIGNGHSLSPESLERLTEEYTFATNLIGKMYTKTRWRPSFYACFDVHVWDKHGDLVFPNLENCEYSFVSDVVGRRGNFSEHDTEKVVNVDTIKGAHPDLSNFGPEDKVHMYSTTMYPMFQIAVWMGFNPIYLLANDLYGDGPLHFYDEDIMMAYKPSRLRKIRQNQIIAHGLIALHAEKHNVSVMNATEGGDLEVHERVKLDEVFK